MDTRQENSKEAFYNKVHSLIAKIEVALKDQDDPPVKKLILINDLQDIIAQQAPFETQGVNKWLATNIDFFKENKSIFQTLFSKIDIYDALKELGSLYIRRTNIHHAMLQSAMESESNKAIESFVQSDLEVPLDKAMADLFKKYLGSEKDFTKLAILFDNIQSKYKASEIIAWINENQINNPSKVKNPLILFLAQTPCKILDIQVFRSLKQNSIQKGIVNDASQTPLEVAILKGNFNFVSNWCRHVTDITMNAYNLARDHKNDSPESKKIYSLIKTPSRARKHSILAKKPLFEITHLTTFPIHPTLAICSQVYYEGDIKNLSEPLITRLNSLVDYEKAPLLAPLLYVFALAALGKHREGLKSTAHNPKFFKTVLTKEERLGNLVFTSSSSFGAYTTKNTLFVAMGDESQTVISNIPIIFHEASHFVAWEVMQNLCRPYRAEDTKNSNSFPTIVQLTLSRAHQLSQELDFDNLSPEEVAVWGFFLTRFEYHESRHEAELFVVFAQTIAVLGYERGCQFIESRFPEFFNFYKDTFYPECIAYLRDHQVQKYLDVGEVFLNVLTENPEVHAKKTTPNF